MSPDEREKRPRDFPPLAVTVEHFQATLDALRELLDVAMPHLETLDSTRLAPATVAALAGLEDEKREKLRVFLEERLSERAAEIEEQDGEDESDGLGTDAKSRSDPAAVVDDIAQSAEQHDPADPDAGALDSSTREQLDDIFGGNPVPIMDFMMGIARASVSPNRVGLLSESVLTQSVAALEALLVGVASEHYLLFPANLESTNKEFSLIDLSRFESIDDARYAAIEDRVQNLMRGSLDDWAEWFEKRYKIDFRPFTDFEMLTEIFQRRHVLVHNGGRVSRIYLTKVRKPPGGAKLGRRLHTPPDYVTDAIDAINVVGVLIGVSLWCRWRKEEKDFAIDRLFKTQYSLMLAGRWATVQSLALATLQVVPLDASGEQVTRANLWLAHKRLDDFERVRDDVLSWDTSALAPRFRLARAALLDDLDEVFALIVPTHASNDISQGGIVEWPILEEMRGDSRYPALLESLTNT